MDLIAAAIAHGFPDFVASMFEYMPVISSDMVCATCENRLGDPTVSFDFYGYCGISCAYKAANAYVASEYPELVKSADYTKNEEALRLGHGVCYVYPYTYCQWSDN